MSLSHTLVNAPSLDGGLCESCGLVLIPRPLACRRCGHEVVPHAVAPAGVIEALTTIHVASPGFETPYVIGYAKLEAGPRLLVRLNGRDGTTIERMARVVIRPAEPGALPIAEPVVGG